MAVLIATLNRFFRNLGNCLSGRRSGRPKSLVYYAQQPRNLAINLPRKQRAQIVYLRRGTCSLGEREKSCWSEVEQKSLLILRERLDGAPLDLALRKFPFGVNYFFTEFNCAIPASGSRSSVTAPQVELTVYGNSKKHQAAHR
jgi:hypothetical protein